jgi:large subunit ribosomal protein L23
MALLDRFKKQPKKEEKRKKKEKKIELKAERTKEKPILKEETKQKEIKGDKNQLARAYQIIKGAHITEKATFLSGQNKYVFRVSARANKKGIKEAIEALYGVKVDRVHIVHSAPKKRRLGRYEGWRQGLKKGFKKAIVSLKEGEKIELSPR